MMTKIFGLVLWHINHYRLLMPNPFLYIKIILFQTIQFSMSMCFVYTQSNVKTVIFQTIQFSISTHFSSIWPISGATTPRHSRHGSDGNEGVLRIPQSSSITGTSPSDCLVSYLRHSLGGGIPLCRDAVSVFYRPSRLGKIIFHISFVYSDSLPWLENNLRWRKVIEIPLWTSGNPFF